MNAPVTSSSVQSTDGTPRGWARTLAATLKLKQQEHRDLPPTEREQRLESELRDALQRLPLENREEYLRALAETFPSWEAATQSTFAPTKREPQTPSNLVDGLVEAAPRLTPAEREQFIHRLSAAGLAPASQGQGMDPEVLAEVKTRLKLGPAETIDTQRLGKLFVIFADLTLALDQLVWNLWKSAAAQSSIRREISPSEVRALVRRSLNGDAEASAAQVQQTLEATRQLIAGLLAGLGSAGQTFGERFQARYSAESIRAAVQADSGGFFASAEAKCWKHYEELAPELSTEAIESQVREAVVKYTENLIRGTKR